MAARALLLDHPVARVVLHRVEGVEVLSLEAKMFPSVEQVRDFMPKYSALMREHPPARVMTDLRQFMGAPLSVHIEYAKFLGAVRPHVCRSAIFGLRPSTGALVRLVLRLAGRHDMLIAATEPQALDWVLTGSCEKQAV